MIPRSQSPSLSPRSTVAPQTPATPAPGATKPAIEVSFSEEPDGTQHSARFEVNNESILWVTGTPNISYVTFGGDLDALDFQEVADCLSQLNSEAAQHAVPGESTPVTRQINGGELIVVLTLPSDADGTPGAAPMGTQAATVMDLAKQKLALASDVLNQFLIKPLTDMSVAYLSMSDETLPVTPMAMLLKMPRTQIADTGDRTHLPLRTGAHGGVQPCFLGISADNEAAIVAFEAPPPAQAGFEPGAMHPHPNGIAVIYRHPLEDGFWRDTAQPPRTHLHAMPALAQLQAQTHKTVLVAANRFVTGLPVTLLWAKPEPTSPAGQQLVTLRVQSNFHPAHSPLNGWDNAWVEGGVVKDHESPADGVHQWTLQTDLNSDGEDCCCVSFDPLLPPPAPVTTQAGPLPADTKACERTGDTKAPAGSRASVALFATLPLDTPVHVNGVAARFQGEAAPSEAPDAIWVTIDRDTDTSGIGSIRSVVVPGTNLLSHLVSCTQSTVTLG